MPRRRNAVGAVATIALISALAGCGGETNTTVVVTTTTIPTSTTLQTPATSTTILVEGPETLVSGGLLEPGEYVTTVFEPTVMYRIERKHLLRAFQNERVTGFENYRNEAVLNQNPVPFMGIGIQNFWRGLSGEEVLEKLEEFEQIELGQEAGTAVGGFPGRRIEAVVKTRVGLWHTESGGEQGRGWLVAPGPLNIIILETRAGTLLITINADAELWDDFLPIAEEILEGISFPDL